MMRADVGILCALREHLSFLTSITTPLVNCDGSQLVGYQGTVLGIALQGRTSALSYHNARNLVRQFQPALICTFGPAAAVTEDAALGQWYEATRCAWLDQDGCRLPLRGGGPPICRMPAPAHGVGPQHADLLVSAESFVADTAGTQRLAERHRDAVTLLDMTGYGVSQACADVGLPWSHFRWTTDRASDTAVSQFTRNVRTLAKRGNEVVRILEEVLSESSIVVCR